MPDPLYAAGDKVRCGFTGRSMRIEFVSSHRDRHSYGCLYYAETSTHPTAVVRTTYHENNLTPYTPEREPPNVTDAAS